MNCPFVYADGKRCEGIITELKIIKPHYSVFLTPESKVDHAEIYTEYHVHLRCSVKGGHSRDQNAEDEQMKIWFNDLPEEILRVIELRGGVSQ